MTADPGPWGPRVEGGRQRPRVLLVVAAVTLALLAALASTGTVLYLQADDALTRVPVDGLADPGDGDPQGTGTETSSARHFLVVGSDSRVDTTEYTDEIPLGEEDGQRSDVLMHVSLTDDRDGLSIVSIPRDLVVERDGREQRISDTFEDGADSLVAAVQEELGLPVNHYLEVDFDGFIDVVDTLGGVDICLEDDLVDPDAGADLRAGCQRLEPPDALAFVRSRQGDRADFERMDRQHRFVRATLSELTQRRVFADVPRLFSLVEDVAGNVTTDENLTVRQMLGLAEELREVVDDDLPMVSVPAYPDTLGPALVMRAYEPGARALFRDVAAGRQPAYHGTREQRAETSVALWTGGRMEGTERVASALMFAGFGPHGVAGPGPEELDAGATTTVYGPTADDPAAARVAALLGAPTAVLPSGIEVPGGRDVAVAVGRDAAGELTTSSAPSVLDGAGLSGSGEEAGDTGGGEEAGDAGDDEVGTG